MKLAKGILKWGLRIGIGLGVVLYVDPPLLYQAAHGLGDGFSNIWDGSKQAAMDYMQHQAVEQAKQGADHIMHRVLDGINPFK